jgi:secondary thiamine-phosphate synthase enzyme
MKKFRLKTGRTEEMVDISADVQRLIEAADFKDGLALVYCPHTTAGLTLNEGADPAVRADILDGLSALVPWDRLYGHAEGNSPAHIKASLLGSSALVIVANGRIALGQWQRLFFCEFDGPRLRQVYVRFIGASPGPPLPGP